MRVRILIIFLIVLWLPGQAASEPYAGLYAGAAFTPDRDVKADGFELKDVEIENSFLIGAKFGVFYNMPALWGNLGIEIDISHFQADIEEQNVRISFDGQTDLRVLNGDLRVVPVGVNLMYRYRILKSMSYPYGIIQPYAGVGVGFVWTHFESDSPLLGFDDDNDTKASFQALGGLKVFLFRNLALFAEYKYISTDEFEYDIAGSEVKADLDMHHIYGGLAWHW